MFVTVVVLVVFIIAEETTKPRWTPTLSKGSCQIDFGLADYGDEGTEQRMSFFNDLYYVT